MEISPCCNSVAGHQIATNFCICYDSTAVVPCTKFCSDHCIRIELRVKRNFHRIWIVMEEPLVKRGPGPCLPWGTIPTTCTSRQREMIENESIFLVFLQKTNRTFRLKKINSIILIITYYTISISLLIIIQYLYSILTPLLGKHGVIG